MSNPKNPTFIIQVRETSISDVYIQHFPASQSHCPESIGQNVGARLSSRGSLTLRASWAGAKPAPLWQRMGNDPCC